MTNYEADEARLHRLQRPWDGHALYEQEYPDPDDPPDPTGHPSICERCFSQSMNDNGVCDYGCHDRKDNQ